MRSVRRLLAAAVLPALVLVLALAAPAAWAASPAWQLEKITGPAGTQLELGRIGDVEFLEPNLGLLISAGNGRAVEPGVWVYNGQGWRELSTVCGASDGRVAWAGPEEFWTIADGRPGQAANSQGELPPLRDNTLCRFGKHQPGGAAPLEVLTSYASLAFSASSYQAMHTAACDGASDCWFAGSPLPFPLQGAFQLHWNGSSVSAEPNLKATEIGDVRSFQGQLVESAALPRTPPPGERSLEEIEHPTLLYEIAPEGVSPPFRPLRLASARTEGELLPEFVPKRSALTLEYLHLAADGESLWAAGQAREPLREGEPANALTVLRESGGAWTEVLGPEGPKKESLTTTPAALARDEVIAIAPEPGTGGAWLALRNPEEPEGPTATARVVHLTASGEVGEEAEVPDAEQRAEGIAGKGGATALTCPAAGDCWLATTQGALFHLSPPGEQTLPPNPYAALYGSQPITFRPEDEGLPKLPSDVVPADTSGEHEAPPVLETLKVEAQRFATVPVALVSHMRARVIRGDVLELRFQLATRARVKLIAKWRHKVVASTATRTLTAGRHSLMLRLDRRRWPTNLVFQTHALAPLPTVSSRSNSVEAISTSFLAPGALERRLLGSWR